MVIKEDGQELLVLTVVKETVALRDGKFEQRLDHSLALIGSSQTWRRRAKHHAGRTAQDRVPVRRLAARLLSG